MKIAIQGQQTSYHHQAAQQFFGNSVTIVPCDTFKDVFAAVESGRAKQGIVAIENSLYGSINPVYDLLLNANAHIIGEVYLRIEHQLIGLPDSSISKITGVHSQLEALAQCEDFLDKNLPHAQRLEEHDTAASVKIIKKLGDNSQVAIASKAAAELYGLKILAANIETHHQNYTRFVVISSSALEIQDANKTSIVLTTKADTKPGALYKALGTFAKRNLNLTMLQSRPLVGRAWHYMFYVDVESSGTDEDFEDCLDELRGLGYQASILGSYKAEKKQT